MICRVILNRLHVVAQCIRLHGIFIGQLHAGKQPITAAMGCRGGVRSVGQCRKSFRCIYGARGPKNHQLAADAKYQSHRTEMTRLSIFMVSRLPRAPQPMLARCSQVDLNYIRTKVSVEFNLSL
jgi:hypothetical protein